MKFRKNFKKIIYGYIEVEAKNKEEAQEKQDDGVGDEFDNKSDYEFEEWKEVEK